MKSTNVFLNERVFQHHRLFPIIQQFVKIDKLVTEKLKKNILNNRSYIILSIVLFISVVSTYNNKNHSYNKSLFFVKLPDNIFDGYYGRPDSLL